MQARRRVVVATAAFAFAAMAVSGQAVAAPNVPSQGPSADAAQVAAYWTAAKRASAIPRDITVDASGRSFIGSGTNLKPYGSGARIPAPTLVADAPQQRAGGPKGGGKGDTTAPDITDLNPAAGTTVTTSSVDFSATVTDEAGGSGIKSVAFVITYPDGRTQSFSPGLGANDVWTITLNGFTDGDWSWEVVAKDNGARGGNTAESALTGFTVDLGGTKPPPPASGDVANDPWTADSAVRTASGRLLFEMPTNKRGNRWQAYVCSATVVADGITGDANSLLLTAAHCVYDEGSGFFARNVLFIPDQQATTGTRTDSDCANDPIGCWAPTFGVVDEEWTTNAWPANIPWDYGYYVVPNVDSHTAGITTTTGVLETDVSPMTIKFSSTMNFDGASAFGYSYSEDPKFMYCSQARGYTGGTSAGTSDNWWLDQCGLTGGASGGPWLDEYPAAGSGEIISVNSWGYSNQPGMAGPKLDGTTSTPRLRAPVCVYDVATGGLLTEDTKVTSC